jgi:hypothetical protein
MQGAGFNHLRRKQCRRAGCIPFHTSSIDNLDMHGVSFSPRNGGLCGIQSVQYQNELKCRCREQSGTGIRESSLIPECSGTGLRC